MSWSVKLCLFLIFTSILNYFLSYAIANSNRKKLSLYLAILYNIVILSYFKYAMFIAGNLNIFFKSLEISYQFNIINILIPLGISFYTFQTISYLVDIYRGQIKFENNIVNFLLYISFFPQLIAGPIEKSTFLLPQIQKNRVFDAKIIKASIFLFIIGLCKKVIVADNLAPIVDNMMQVTSVNLYDIMLIGFLFFIQVYFDFSGYTNMARGLGGAFGISLSENFKLPFLATNPSNFWNRWHITLTDWVRYYLYNPLLLKSRSPYLASLICFPLMGLWHGAGWMYLLWGIYWMFARFIHHFVILFSQQFKLRISKKVPPFFKVLLMLFITSLSFYIFRLALEPDVIKSLQSLKLSTYNGIGISFLKENLTPSLILLIFGSLSCDTILEKYNGYNKFSQKNVYFQILIYMLLFFIYRSFSGVGEREFIYFQF